MLTFQGDNIGGVWTQEGSRILVVSRPINSEKNVHGGPFFVTQGVAIQIAKVGVSVRIGTPMSLPP